MASEVNQFMGNEPDCPLEDEELKEIFSYFESFRKVVVAVSGGPDSMALMAGLARWRVIKAVSLNIIVAVVDHGLRRHSALEAEMVCREAARLNLEPHLLSWQGDKPLRGIQEAARNARYDLLTSLCHREQADALLTAHTQDDQAETVLMRLARGSGLSGLRGMDFDHLLRGVHHLRPLLGICKSRLIASCRVWNIPFVDDPSNENECFTRVRWRKLMPVLAKEGLDSGRLAAVAKRFARADEALERKAGEFFSDTEKSRIVGEKVKLNAHYLYKEPLEIVIRVFRLALVQIVGSENPIRLNRLETCAEHVGNALANTMPLKRTLAGVLILLDSGGVLTFEAEPQRRRGILPRNVNCNIEIG